MNIRTKGIVFLLVCGLILGLFTAALGDGLEEARHRGMLRVGIKTDFAPFGFTDPSGQIQGFDVDLARYLARVLFDDEQALELVPVTSGSRIPLLYSESVDLLIAAMNVTEDRQRVLDFTEAYLMTGSALLTLKQSPIHGVQELADRRVAVVSGAVQEKDLPLIAPLAKLVSFNTLTEALNALRGKQVDALCQDDIVLLKEAAKDSSLRVAGNPFIPRPYAMAVRKGDDTFLKWLNLQIDKMKRDGTLRQLRQKYFEGMEDKLLPQP
ncbi:MAG: transporter substrate-binding domain-containing protein [Desulfobacteraceae bacterium]|nr:transporter substrate-binding domain-containing protein [Desulfobacteraceae bacterium]